MLHGNAVGVPSPVPETFRKRETARNAWKRSGNDSEKKETFHVVWQCEVLSRKHLGNVYGPFKCVSGPGVDVYSKHFMNMDRAGLFIWCGKEEGGRRR